MTTLDAILNAGEDPFDPSVLPKTVQRFIKSAHFTDSELFVYANKRAESLYGGNFSAYISDLVKRDRESCESRRVIPDFEALILRIIAPYGGVQAPESRVADFEVPSIGLSIVRCMRFPRERTAEYRLLNSLQKLSFNTLPNRVALVFPSDLSTAEKERFRQFDAAGIENLCICDSVELGLLLNSLFRAQAEASDTP